MFGLGKKKVNLGQAARLITNHLHEYPDTDYSQAEEVRNNFDEDDIKYFINVELNLLKYTALYFEFLMVALEKRSSMDSEKLAQTVTYAMRLSFEDFSYKGETLENMANYLSRELEYMTESLIELESVSRDDIELNTTRSFTKNLLENTLEVGNKGEKNTVITYHSTVIIVAVRNIMKDFLKQFKIIEF